MFNDVTNDNIDKYLESGQLKRIYLISPDYFGGSEGIENQFIGTPDAEKEKQLSDNELYNALKNGKKVNHAWFCGFFPYDTPEYTCIVFAEDAVSGSATCAPLFKKIADAINNLK